MPHLPEQNIHAGQAPTEAGEHDFFLSLSIKRGPKFYGGKRHGTSREVAEVLKEYATHSEGLLREAFVLLAKLHLQAVEQVPAYAQNATGSLPGTVVWGDCGSCTLANGDPGRTFTIYVDGVAGKPDCYPCSPSGSPSG
jgi:hypothetical protein